MTELRTIQQIVRIEVRLAIRDMYHRMGYDETSSAGWRDVPRPLDSEWVSEPVDEVR